MVSFYEFISKVSLNNFIKFIILVTSNLTGLLWNPKIYIEKDDKGDVVKGEMKG